ncbi:hypothetical protein NIES4102_44360 (plasmid) [Chondrocystis sp. NIES-4102]|nr:hypothetical protein NIES4102_44360 [Chondrocystis sp. NIES-4102]
MDKKSALSRKPKPKNQNVDAFIARGLSTGTEKKLTIDDDTEVSRVQLRLTKGKLKEIDEALSQRKVKVSRHVWLLEAIEEKLEKETL